MDSLEIVTDSFEYKGTFSAPPMRLWGNGPLLVGGLLETLRGHNVALSNIRLIPGTDNAADGVVSINVGQILVEFRFESLRVLLSSVGADDLQVSGDVVRDVSRWLEETAGVVSVSHAIAYAAHCKFGGSTNSNTYLTRFLTSPTWPKAIARPAGVMFHYRLSEWLPDAQLDLTLDHSLQVQGGLWMMALTTLPRLERGIGALIPGGRSVLDDLLATIDLRIAYGGDAS